MHPAQAALHNASGTLCLLHCKVCPGPYIEVMQRSQEVGLGSTRTCITSLMSSPALCSLTTPLVEAPLPFCATISVQGSRRREEGSHQDPEGTGLSCTFDQSEARICRLSIPYRTGMAFRTSSVRIIIFELFSFSHRATGNYFRFHQANFGISENFARGPGAFPSPGLTVGTCRTVNTTAGTCTRELPGKY